MDIQPGDLVEALNPDHACLQCLNDGVEIGEDGPGAGRIDTVQQVVPDRNCPMLYLVGYSVDGYSSCCFRKIQPYAERFATELRNAVPSKEPVSS